MATKKRPLKPITFDSMNEEPSSLLYVGNLAVQPEHIDEIPEKKQKKEKKAELHVVPKTVKQQKTKSTYANTKRQISRKDLFQIFVGVISVFLLGWLLTSKYALISSYNSLIADKETELEDLYRQSQQMEIEYAMTDDLNTVMAIASNELNMGIPQDEMRREIVLNDRINEDAVEADAEVQTGEGVLSAMFEKISENMR